MRIWFLVGVIICCFLPAPAQVLQNNPPSLKWYQLETPHFRLIYPRGFDAQAQRTAQTLETVYEGASATMGARPKRIPIVLQTQSALSNGFVTLAPRRSEFFTMPTQNYGFAGNNDWIELLAVHEYRHIVQFQRSQTGITGMAARLFGQQTAAAAAFLAVPLWFWEGDAVAIETAFTPSGRGRIPEFDMMLRTHFVEGRAFNYHKQLLRSFKDNIPNHYVLGYHMVSYLRERTGDARIWDRIAGRAWANPILPFTFSTAIKAETGLNVQQLYREMAADRAQKWKEQVDSLSLTAFERLSPVHTTFTDYQFPHALADGDVVALKSGLGDIEKLVLLSGKKIFVPGLVNPSAMLSVAGGRVVWNEYRFDPRWPMRTYSVIVSYDLENTVKRQITRKSSYAGAALTSDGRSLVTVETDDTYNTTIVLLTADSGRVIRQFPVPEGAYYSMPRFEKDDRGVILLRTANGRKSVIRLDTQTGAEEEIVPPTLENIGHPFPFGDFILYSSPRTGIDNIYAFHRPSGRYFQVTVSRLGAFSPTVSPDGRFILYSDQTGSGLSIVRIPWSPESWKEVPPAVPEVRTFLQHLLNQEPGRMALADKGNQTYATRRYRTWKHLFNPHSWGPFVDPSNLAQLDVGITSRDVLSTTQLFAGYNFDVTERTGQWKGRVSYQGWYPILDAEVVRGDRQESAGVLGREVQLRWRETGVSGGLRVPFNFTHSRFLTQMAVENSVQVLQVNDFRSRVFENGVLVAEGTRRFVLANDSLAYGFIGQADNGTLIANRFLFSFVNTLKRSPRDFNPRWGQFVVAESYATPFGGDFTGWLAALRAGIYAPGIAKHHSLLLRYSVQAAKAGTDTDIYHFRNRVFRPRGHAFPRDSRFWGFSVNYALPLFYPDWALGPLLNIQRVRMNLFYDWGRGSGRNYFYHISKPQLYFSSASSDYLSLGAELTFDFNLFRLPQPFEAGVRTSLTSSRFTNGVVIEVLIAGVPL